MIDTPKLNLRQKLIQIYNELDHVDKAGDNTKQHYKFVRAADVMRPVRAAFAKWGIYAEPDFTLLGTYDIKTNNGGNMHTATVKATIVLFDADSDETKTISGLGDGADGGDKGIFKAQTGAVKNALRNGLLLPDEGDPNGGDPEADENVDDRTAGSYVHNSSTTEIPDFQDAQRGPAHSDYSAPRPTPAARPATAPPSTTKASRAENESASSTTLPEAAPFVTNAAGSPAPASVSPEHICIDGDHQKCTDSAVAAAHGDAYEGPDDNGSLPTEEELVAYRTKFKILGDDLSAKGKLKSSQGLPINRKLLVFLIGVTKAADAKNITKAQWDNFFGRVEAATANPEVGLIGLAALVNRANGIEPKK